MNSIVAHLEDLDRSLAVASRGAFDGEQIPDLPDAEISALLEASGRIQKRIEALQVEASVQVLERSAPMRDDKITEKYGWSRPVDLVRALTRTETRDANRVVKTARLMSRTRGMSSGEFVPARYPALRAAMVSGAIGTAGLLAAIEPLEQSRDRILDDERLEADRQLADLARGIIRDDEGRTVGTGPLPAPEDLRLLSRVLVAYLDPDGAEPSDRAGARARSFSIGRERDGRVPIRGDILPEVAGQLQLLQDSILNPRVDGPDDPTGGVHFTESNDEAVAPNGEPHATPADDRTRAQKMHDAFAMIVNAAARAGEFPDIGGAAPTLVVTVTAEDYATGSGWATVLNTGDRIPSRIAAQTGCAGGIQRVLFDENGRIAALGTSARIFNALQRRAITLRDGGCVIPGCTVPASWCEIHHVVEYADGGPTHTDNGVLLCWWHHRNLHLSEWRIRMNRGVPEVRGPRWWDHEQRWHPAGSPRPRVRTGGAGIRTG
ncbi:HNH endonuclease [Microbacterium aerolatum]|uniref:HNH endonuclease signature motif containing protein n=1 Tax=Microbacterium aerolatum TaxID=153731 RepID=UPI002001AAA0|nr:HNH endonuclease signature motif containing protein [Microbacterium aerolatum]MCK3769139.1 HNH endonuclease [Microbacterium aerolatum]